MEPSSKIKVFSSYSISCISGANSANILSGVSWKIDRDFKINTFSTNNSLSNPEDLMG
jgi:hypothetical protein